MIHGTGCSPFRGGLCRLADQEGLGQVVSALERLESAVSVVPAVGAAARGGGAGDFYTWWPGGRS